MENVNLHKQKLYALIVAAVALVSLLLTWSAPKGFVGVQSQNGFASWGYLSLIGIAGVAVATFMGDKTKAYEGQTRLIALGSFAAIALGAIIFLLRLLTGSQTGMGYTIKYSDIAKPGVGLFLCLIAGAAGFAWLMGLIKLPETKTPSSAPPPPPPPTA